MTTTAKLGLELLANAASNQVLANMTFAQLNQLVNGSVVSRTLAAPPGSPANEAAYIVAASPTGLWAGRAGQIAYWLTSTNAWQFIAPKNGFRVKSVADSAFYQYDGANWVVESGGGGSAFAPVVNKTATAVSLALADAGTYICASSASAITYTVTNQTAVAWAPDTEITIERSGSGSVTIAAAAGVILNKMAANTLSIAAQFGVITLKRTASNTWTVFGALGV